MHEPRYGIFPGGQIGDYILGTRVGRGGMADVYSAQHRSTSRTVAIKIITYATSLDDELSTRRFAQEAKVIALLEHLHIVPIYDYGITPDGIAYIVMRMMSRSLADFMRERRLTIAETVRFFDQVSSALAYAHSRGVIHRDIKPSNILLDDEGNAYLTDFGFAKLLQSSQQLTKTGFMIGAPAYSAPEQLRDTGVDERADVFGLGVLLYAMLTGRTPFEDVRNDLIRLIDMQLNIDPPPPGTLNDEIPPALDQIVMRAIKKSPADRFQSVEAMHHALRDTTDGLPNVAQMQSLPTSGDFASPWLSLLITVLSIGLLVLVLVVLISQRSEHPVVEVGIGDRGTTFSLDVTEQKVAMAQRVSEGGYIAVIVCTLNSQFSAARAREITDRLDQYQLPYRVLNSEFDADFQSELITDAMNNGAVGFIICPLPTETVRERLRTLRDRKFPVVLLHPLPGVSGVVSIDPQDYQAGRLAGEFAGEWLQENRGGEGQVVILTQPLLPSSDERERGLRDGLSATAPNADIVLELSVSSDSTAGFETTHRLLESRLHFDMILAVNDSIAVGSVRTLSEVEVAPDAVSIVSIDGENIARQYLSQGLYLRGIAIVAREESATVAVQALLNLLSSTPLPEFIDVPNIGMTSDSAD